MKANRIIPSFKLPKPWWKTAIADTPEKAAELCKRLGTGECAAICLSHSSLFTAPGQCPESFRVWGPKDSDPSDLLKGLGETK